MRGRSPQYPGSRRCSRGHICYPDYRATWLLSQLYHTGCSPHMSGSFGQKGLFRLDETGRHDIFKGVDVLQRIEMETNISCPWVYGCISYFDWLQNVPSPSRLIFVLIFLVSFTSLETWAYCTQSLLHYLYNFCQSTLVVPRVVKLTASNRFTN